MNVEVRNVLDSEQLYATSKETREWIKSILKEGIADVTFIKKDGSTRVMKCTLKETLIPKPEITEPVKVVDWSDEAQRVYDIEVQGWRSFRWDSIKSISFSI